METIELIKDHTHKSNVWKKGDKPTVSHALAERLRVQNIAKKAALDVQAARKAESPNEGSEPLTDSEAELIAEKVITKIGEVAAEAQAAPKEK